MSAKATIALGIAAGFVGGIVSQHIVPASVWAQEQASVPQEIRAHKFVLVDDAGVSRGVFGFAPARPRFGFGAKGAMHPAIEMMDTKGEVWSFTTNEFGHYGLLPDATCPSCTRKPSKTGP
jgi:hypothetical protein